MQIFINKKLIIVTYLYSIYGGIFSKKNTHDVISPGQVIKESRV